MKPVKFRLFLLLILLIALFSAAQVYQWVDEKGQVQFGDRPPENMEAQELTLPEGPPAHEIDAAKEKLRKTLLLRKEKEKRLTEELELEDKNKMSDRLADEQRFEHCVTARQQAAVLKRSVRVFKLNTDWSRTYMDDKGRPEKIARLENQITEYCDTDSDSVRKQLKAGQKLNQALNIRCINAREELYRMNDPNTEIDEERKKEYQEYLAANCPDVARQDLWIADWVFVNTR